MWTDPIVEEVRQARAEYAKQFDGDLSAIVRGLQANEEAHADQIVRLPPRAPVAKPSGNIREKSPTA